MRSSSPTWEPSTTTLEPAIDRVGAYIQAVEGEMAGTPDNAISLVRLMTDFYRRVVESSRLAHFFAEVSMESLIAHQAAFIATIKDTTPRYSDQHIFEAHSNMNITDDDFDELLRLLRATLLDHQMPEADIDLIMNEFSSRRPIVVMGQRAAGT